jgi:hypothetical protein
VVNCGSPTAILHASLPIEGATEYQDIQINTCDIGYTSNDGNGETICKDDGNWSSTSLNCTGKHYIIQWHYRLVQ